VARVWESEGAYRVSGRKTVGMGKLVRSRQAFLKLWSADHKWSSVSVLVVLLD
jgi:hypothetical protein